MLVKALILKLLAAQLHEGHTDAALPYDLKGLEFTI